MRLGSNRFDIGTAGATNLVAQTIVVPPARQSAPSRVTITGGTHVPQAPTTDYLEAVYLPALRRAGIAANVSYSRSGLFPKIRGMLELEITDIESTQPLDLAERGKVGELTDYIVTSNLPDHLAERGAATIKKFLKTVGREARIEIRRLPALDPRVGGPGRNLRERLRGLHQPGKAGEANGKGRHAAVRGVHCLVEGRRGLRRAPG